MKIKRLRDIQNHLVKHIEKEIQDEDDFMYMATMLLKHKYGSVQDVFVRR